MRAIILALAVSCAGLEGCASLSARRAAEAPPSLDALVFAVPPGHRFYQSVTLGRIYGLPTVSPVAGLSHEAIRTELSKVIDTSGMMAKEDQLARYAVEVEFSRVSARPFGRGSGIDSLAVYRIVDRRARTTVFSTAVDNFVRSDVRNQNYGWGRNDPIGGIAADKPLRVRAVRQSVASFVFDLSEREHIPMKKLIPCSTGVNAQEERAAAESHGYGWVEEACPEGHERVRVIY